MCFSPQPRAFFQHLNLQKWSKHVVFCTFSLQNVLFATAACIFSTGEQQKVLRTWRVLYIFTSKCAFRHSGVQFLISPLTTWLRTRRFNRPTFGLTRHTNHRENTAFRDFSNIWRGCIFLLLTFALLHLLPSDLTACLIYFSTLHIVGSLLFKLPSISLEEGTSIDLWCTNVFQSPCRNPLFANTVFNLWGRNQTAIQHPKNLTFGYPK